MNLQLTKTLPLLKVFNSVFNADEFLLSQVHDQSILLDVAENAQDYLWQSRVRLGRLFCTPQSNPYFVFYIYLFIYLYIYNLLFRDAGGSSPSRWGTQLKLMISPKDVTGPSQSVS